MPLKTLNTEFCFSSKRFLSGFRLRYNEHAALGAQTLRRAPAGEITFSRTAHRPPLLFVVDGERQVSACRSHR